MLGVFVEIKQTRSKKGKKSLTDCDMLRYGIGVSLSKHAFFPFVSLALEAE